MKRFLEIFATILVSSFAVLALGICALELVFFIDNYFHIPLLTGVVAFIELCLIITTALLGESWRPR